MKALTAFLKKDLSEQLRSGKLLILVIIFILLGIMNPAVAKLTPWLMETLSEELAENGMYVSEVRVDALSSWTQFFKNIPIGLIVFVLLESSILTAECQSGTLIPMLTKGLSRRKVVVSKALVLTLLWTALYWLCYGLTFAYNAYFWDNSIAKSLGFSAFCFWLMSICVLTLMLLFSAVCRSNSGVLAGTGGAFLAAYLLGLLPKLEKYSPAFLSDGNSLVYGAAQPDAYSSAIAVTAVLCLVCFAAAIPIFDKKQL